MYYGVYCTPPAYNIRLKRTIFGCIYVISYNIRHQRTIFTLSDTFGVYYTSCVVQQLTLAYNIRLQRSIFTLSDTFGVYYTPCVVQQHTLAYIIRYTLYTCQIWRTIYGSVGIPYDGFLLFATSSHASSVWRRTKYSVGVQYTSILMYGKKYTATAARCKVSANSVHSHYHMYTPARTHTLQGVYLIRFIVYYSYLQFI